MPIFSLHESQYMRLLRYKLWAKDPRCIYCGIETILPDDCHEKGKSAPPHMATIDHKYSKLNPLRDIKKQEYLLCCNLCNNYRGQLEQDKLPLEELQKRSRKGFKRERIVKKRSKPYTVQVKDTPTKTVSIQSPFMVFKKWVKGILRPSLPFQK